MKSTIKLRANGNENVFRTFMAAEIELRALVSACVTEPQKQRTLAALRSPDRSVPLKRWMARG